MLHGPVVKGCESLSRLISHLLRCSHLWEPSRPSPGQAAGAEVFVAQAAQAGPSTLILTGYQTWGWTMR